MRINAADLAERVSRLLDYLGIKPAISSGFRTLKANSKAGGSRTSAHLTGQAVDLEDAHGRLSGTIHSDPGVLDRFNLYMENPYYTPGWCHLSTRGPPSGRRIFVP